MKEILRRHSFSIAFITLLFAFFFTRPGQEEGIYQLTGFTMGTTFRLQAVALPDDLRREQLRDQVVTLLNHLDKELFSTYAPDSQLSRFNNTPVGQPFRVDPEVIEVASLAQEISRLTGGAFDITVGPLVNLWGFGPGANSGKEVIPDDGVIAAALEVVGYGNLQIDARAATLLKTKPVYLDMSAIAKGYAVDKVAQLFEQSGIQDYFLEIGGELKIRGSKPEHRAWVPAIERPVDTAPQVYQLMHTDGAPMALAGSGDYRNYFEVNGQRYSHEIDPRNGRPIRHNLAAVYVMDQSTARADALATAFMVLGFEQGRILAENNRLAVYFIYRRDDGSFADFTTAAFEPYLTPGN